MRLRADEMDVHIENIQKTYSYKTGLKNSTKREMFDAYGGKCTCCGESNYGFLTIDHIHRDGRKDREIKEKSYGKIYKWLKDNDFPKDRYRVLCMNCNWASRIDGTCPHDND